MVALVYSKINIGFLFHHLRCICSAIQLKMLAHTEHPHNGA